MLADLIREALTILIGGAGAVGITAAAVTSEWWSR